MVIMVAMLHLQSHGHYGEKIMLKLASIAQSSEKLPN